MCGNLISLRRTVFQDWRLVKKSSSIDPETPERAIISVFKSYLVHLGSFKRHILYFCASIVEKIRSHWGEPYEAKFVVVSIPTNGSNVAFNVVIWLSFLSIKVLQSTIYLWRIFFKRWICKEELKRVSSIQPWSTNGTQRRVKLICDMSSDCLQQFNLSSAWNQKDKTQQSFVVHEVVWGLRRQTIEHETF